MVASICDTFLDPTLAVATDAQISADVILLALGSEFQGALQWQDQCQQTHMHAHAIAVDALSRHQPDVGGAQKRIK